MPEKITREEAEDLIYEMLDQEFAESEIRRIMLADHAYSYSQTNAILAKIESTQPEQEVVYFDGHPLQPSSDKKRHNKAQFIRNPNKDRDIMIGGGFLILGFILTLIAYYADLRFRSGMPYVGFGSIVTALWFLGRGLS